MVGSGRGELGNTISGVVSKVCLEPVPLYIPTCSLVYHVDSQATYMYTRYISCVNFKEGTS